jgi:hypothetical protein
MAIQDAGTISEEIFKAKAPYLIPTEGNCRDAWQQTCSTKLLRRTTSENVALMRRNSSQLAGHRQIEVDSDKTVDFSARKSSVAKRQREGI